MGMIPKSTKSEIKIFNAISFMKILGLIIVIMVDMMFAPLIFSKNSLIILFTIFTCVVYIVGALKAPTDPTKVFAAGVRDWIFFKLSNKTLYGNNSKEYLEYMEEKEAAENEKALKKEKKAAKKAKNN